MGMVPIPVFPPLTLNRPDEPILEPTCPVSRVQTESSNAGEQRDEAYSPSHEQSNPTEDLPGSKSETPSRKTESVHGVNFFA
jgi:hypothetical protein